MPGPLPMKQAGARGSRKGHRPAPGKGSRAPDGFPLAGGRPCLGVIGDEVDNFLKAFNEQFGNIAWKDADKSRKVIAEERPVKVAADKAYQNAMQHSDKQNARIEHEKALGKAIIALMADHMKLFRQFQDNPSFSRWLSETNFASTYLAGQPAAGV